MLPSIALARVHAHLCGDGHTSVYKSSEKDHKMRAEVVYTNKNPALIQEFRDDMKLLFNVKMTKGVKSDVKVKSMRIYAILEPYGPFGSRLWRIPEFISTGTVELKRAWLEAYFKDDAYLELRYNRLKIKSVNLAGLNDTQTLLHSLGVKSNITGKNCDGTWYLTIPKLASTSFSNFQKSAVRKKA